MDLHHYLNAGDWHCRWLTCYRSYFQGCNTSSNDYPWHLLVTLLTYVRSWEAANCPAIQEIPSNFNEPESSSPCSQEPSHGPYPEPVRSSLHHPIPSHPISLRSILILSTYLHLDLPTVLFPSGFRTDIIYAFLFTPIRAACPDHSYSLIHHTNYVLGRSIGYEAPHYAVSPISRHFISLPIPRGMDIWVLLFICPV
jgi:hypothetical protein